MPRRLYKTTLLFILLLELCSFSLEERIKEVCKDLVAENGKDDYSTTNDIIITIEHKTFGEIQSYLTGEVYNVSFQVLNPAIQLKSFVLLSSDGDRWFFGNFTSPLPYSVSNVDGCGNHNTVRGLFTPIPVIRWTIPSNSYIPPPCILLRSKVNTSNSSIIISKKICHKKTEIPKHRFRRNVESASSELCSSGWHEFSSRCYRIFHEKIDFKDAIEACALYNGSLATIRYLNESDFIDQLLRMNSKSSDTYWIGASDILHEADFTWTDGTKVTFEDWFQGWLQYEYFGRQPNDDGYSEQDCVELRREFAIPLKGYDVASRWYWNDISCSAKNGFVCQVPQGKMSIPDADLKYCNTTVTGSSGFVTSPNYPLSYPNNLVCSTIIVVLPGHRVFLEFENFVLENQENCSYDFVRISDFTNNTKISCGNYTGKEKLLTFLSETNFVELTFVSDDSVNFSGFNVSYSSKEVLYSCYDSTWFPIQGKCMKPVATPQLDWEAAFVACYNMERKATLASIENEELQKFLVNKLAQSTATSQYWLAGTDRKDEGVWKWQFADVMVDLTYTNWFQGSGNISAQPSNIVNEDCIVMTNSLSKKTPNSFYWADELCRVRAGYICQQEAKEIKPETIYPYENVIQESYGTIASPNYQDVYLNDMYIKWVFVAPHGYQIVLLFQKFDIEEQINCLYDYILLSDSLGEKRYCGKKAENTFHYNSKDNILNITFVSDYSITFQGFSLSYEIVHECPNMFFTAIEGSFRSHVSFGRYLDNIDCFMNISVPIDRRVVLKFEMFDLKFDFNCEKDFIEIFLSSEYSVRICGNKTVELWKLNYVSYASTMQIQFRTDQSEASKGFHASYSSVSLFGRLNYYAEVMPNVTTTTLTSLNYPNPFPSFTYQETVFFAPTGFHAMLNITEFDFGRGKTRVCSTDVVMVIDYEQYGYENILSTICGGRITNLQNYSFISTYNKIGIRFISGGSEKPLNAGVMASFRITKSNEVWDPGILAPRVVSNPCDSKPCKNGATCIVVEASYTCECTNEFTGIHCAEQRASYLLTEPLWSGTLAIIGLLILMLIATKLKRHCEKTCNCGLKKDVESPFKAYEDNEPSSIYAKYADTDPTADAFSSLIQRLKSGATAQAASVVPTTQKPKLGLGVSPVSPKMAEPLAPKDLTLLNGKMKAKDSLIPNGFISGNGAIVGSWKAKNSHLLKVTADINHISKTTSIDTNTTTNPSQATLKKKTSFSSIIVNDDIEIIHEDQL